MSSSVDTEEVVCPRCKTTRYRNPQLKLMVNACGHSLCESCVSLLFARGSGQCPQCSITLRRTDFKYQRFDDATVEKEIDIRKKVLSEFNKREEDFYELDEYNDYLEQIEVLIFNLYNGIDVEIVKKYMEKNRKENHELIKKNRIKLSKEAKELEDIIETEKEALRLRNKENLDTQINNDKEKVLLKQNLLDDLAFSEESASTIVEKHEVIKLEQMKSNVIREMEKEGNRVQTFSSGVALGMRLQDGPTEPTKVYAKYVYVAPIIETLGPRAPSRKEITTKGYLENIEPATPAEIACGFHHMFVCHRTIQEAYGSLYFSKDDIILA